MAQAACGKSESRSVSRSFPCRLTPLAPTDNGNVESELQLVTSVPQCEALLCSGDGSFKDDGGGDGDDGLVTCSLPADTRCGL